MICTNVRKIESIADTDVLEVTIDNLTTALWLYPFADALPYVGKEVIVSYRNDMYKGNVRQFINSFVEPCKVMTLDRKEGIRLYADIVDNYSNMSFNDIAVGETKNGCILYCVSQCFETSEKAVWVTLTVRDMLFHIAKLRLFHYNNSNDFTGKYIVCALTRNGYGFRTDMIAPAPGDCTDNYEIKIAEDFVLSYFAEDSAAKAILERTGLLTALKDHMDIERGYLLVRLAMELSMCDALYNITGGIDVASITHALIADKLFVLKPNSQLGFQTRNLVLATGLKWTNPATVLSILDDRSLVEVPEREVYQNIKNVVSSVIKANKLVF